MKLLGRYVIRHVLELTGIVALGLVSIYTLVVFVSDINDAGKGDYGVVDVLSYSLLMIPSSLYILMPIIALLGTLMGVGQLSRGSELTAMRAAGVSLKDIAAAVLITGGVLGAFAFALGDWIAPAADHYAEARRDAARGDSIAQSLWFRDADQFIQIRQLESENDVRDLTVYRAAPDGRLTRISTIKQANFDGSHWQLQGVQFTQFGAERVDTAAADHAELKSGIAPSVLRLFILESDSLSLSGLLRLISYLDSNHLDAGKYRLTMWRKLVEPLTVMVMMLFAIPFASGRARDAGTGQRLLIGMLIGIVFYVVNKVSVSLGDIYGWPAPLAASAPTLALAAITAFRLQRAR
ncbi:MAG: export transporter permease LptG [Nevskia sp.]|nr:export transporter permease LptG [Nevskia sp.]